MNDKTSIHDQSASIELNVGTKLIEILYQQAHVALIGVIATATGIAITFYNEVPNTFVIGWITAIYALSFIRYLSIKKFHTSGTSLTDSIKWGWIFTFFTFLSGLSWGLASIIFFTPDNLQLFNILTLIIIAMSAGSLAALSANPRSFYFFLVPAMIPMIWQYLNINDKNYIIFGLLLFVLNFAFHSIIKTNHKTLRESIILRFKNLDLIGQLTLQKEKAELANKSKTKFLAAASHDLRQPLHAISLFLGALEERLENQKEITIVHKIQKSSDSLNELLDSLLDISKLDAGVVQVQTEHFSIESLFQTMQNEFTAYADDKELKISFSHTTLWIDSDFKLLERIIRNLISNAIRYTNKGGVAVGCRRHQGKVQIVVYDTGIGIPQENINEIFIEFHQLHNTERDRSKGLGLGLAIVKRMTDLLGLALVIKSVPGTGSVFGIELPNATSSNQTTNKISGDTKTISNEYQTDLTLEISDNTSLTGKTILIIDDEKEIRDSLSELLQNWRCNVISCASGDKAVQALKQNKTQPNIILADFRLRENETGIEAINKINAFFPNAIIPAIIITGDTAPDRIKETKKSGHSVLHKPVSPVKLKHLLVSTLSKVSS
ncbi:MAG: ATP-binding protein [Gammaproteobacteria bacterium]|nr:ATP-binding protein [Gammaproteobacteria bacterium]